MFSRCIKRGTVSIQARDKALQMFKEKNMSEEKWAATSDELWKLRKQAAELSYSIERLPSHRIQTDLSIQASELGLKIQTLAREASTDRTAVDG